MGFTSLDKTKFIPQQNTMVWDGECSFCAYWIEYWSGLKGNSNINFIPYQEASSFFKDIDVSEFRKASRFIDTNGKIHSGPHSAFKSLSSSSSFWRLLNNRYEKSKSFKAVADKAYNYLASHRSFFFKVTKFLFGSNPSEIKPFWAIYLAIIAYLIYSLVL